MHHPAATTYPPASRTKRMAFGLLALLIPLLFSTVAWSHGDTAPQPVDTGSLPELEEWLESDPFRTGEHHEEAVSVGSRGYNANCARCHGLEAKSGGLAPDLRHMYRDCAGDEDCFRDMDGYYVDTVRRGRTRDGRVYMPPFEGVINQQAMWAILTYIQSLPDED